jgi:cell wall-associated NlpC family hydrolase
MTDTAPAFTPLLSPLNQRILAASLIGLPWAVGAEGPDAFNCWGLVKFWCARVHGVDLGRVEVAAHENQARAIAAAVRSGWSHVKGPAQEHDIALLCNPVDGGRHVGVVLHANHKLGLLHCEGSATHPTPGVVWEPLGDALQRYYGMQLWRLSA